MSTTHKNIESVVNAAIVILAVLLGAVLVKIGLLRGTRRSAVADSARIMPGAKLSVAGVDWSKAAKTLLIVLSTKCRYCAESVPFYQRLTNQKASVGMRLVAILPQNINEAQKYLNDNHISIKEVRQAVPVPLMLAPRRCSSWLIGLARWSTLGSAN